MAPRAGPVLGDCHRSCVRDRRRNVPCLVHSTQWPQPSIDSSSINTLRKKARSGKRSPIPELQPSKSPVRVADVTDDWLQALQSSTLFRRNTSEPGRVPGRHDRGSNPTAIAPAPRARDRPAKYPIPERSPGRWRDVPHHVRSPVRRLLLAHQLYSDQRGNLRATTMCARAVATRLSLCMFTKTPEKSRRTWWTSLGQPYAKLGNAFRHRVGYDPA